MLQVEEKYPNKIRGLAKRIPISVCTQDETTIGSTSLTKMTIDTRNSEPLSQKPYPIVMKHYKWVKDETDKTPLIAKVIWGSWSSWSTPIIVVLNRKWRKMSSHWLSCTQQDHPGNLFGPCQKWMTFFPNWMPKKYFSTLDLQAGYHHIPSDESSTPKTAFISPFGEIWMHQSTLWTHTSNSLLPGTHDRCLKGFPLCYHLPGWHNHLQQDCTGTLRTTSEDVFEQLWNSSLINETQQMPLL